MKKLAVFMLVLGVSVLATGCSRAPATSTQATVTTSPVTEISEIDPLLKQKSFVRLQLTDPALYGYSQTSNSDNGTVLQSSGTVLGQEKIGFSGTFTQNDDFGIAGIAQIIATDKITVKNFSYNGSCGALTISPTTGDNQAKQLANLKTITTPVSQAQFDLTVPSNISLIQFNMLALYCQGKQTPVSSATFN